MYGYSDSAFLIGLFVIFNIFSDEAWLAWGKKKCFLAVYLPRMGSESWQSDPFGSNLLSVPF